MKRPLFARSAAWIPGNRLTLLENGEQFFPDVFTAIRRARRQVIVETFILVEDEVGNALRDALVVAAGNAVEVHLTVDGYGSPALSRDFVQSLLYWGVNLHVYDSRRIFGWRTNPLRRLHRKIVVVDGETAYVGGINYAADQLARSGPTGKQDYALKLEGPIVQAVRGFAESQVGIRKSMRQRLSFRKAAAPSRGSASARFLFRDNALHRDDIEREYRRAIYRARREILICNAYFFPGYRLLRHLRRAARRGVRVRLILQGCPDLPWVQVCTTMLYRTLLRAGIEIHEYRRRPLHGKVAVIDGHWSTVGSSNLDPLSLALNLEANVFVDDPAFAQRLQQRLETLIRQDCQRLDRQGQSGRWAMLLHTLAYHFARHFPAWVNMLPQRRQTNADVGKYETG